VLLGRRRFAGTDFAGDDVDAAFGYAPADPGDGI